MIIPASSRKMNFIEALQELRKDPVMNILLWPSYVVGSDYEIAYYFSARLRMDDPTVLVLCNGYRWCASSTLFYLRQDFEVVARPRCEDPPRDPDGGVGESAYV